MKKGLSTVYNVQYGDKDDKINNREKDKIGKDKEKYVTIL